MNKKWGYAVEGLNLEESGKQGGLATRWEPLIAGLSFPDFLELQKTGRGKFICLNLKELAGQRTYKRKRELGRIVVGVCHERCWSSAGVIYTR
jgi:hypothetical protein